MIALDIRPALEADRDSVWRILEPVIRAGETYGLPRDMSRDAALGYWFDPRHRVLVAVDREHGGAILGTFYLRVNQSGGGDHVANCGFMTLAGFEGQGVARRMGEYALALARQSGFRAMQFNFVIANNTRAVALWESLGFRTLARLPRAFRHPTRGDVDALVMHRALDGAVDDRTI